MQQGRKSYYKTRQPIMEQMVLVAGGECFSMAANTTGAAVTTSRCLVQTRPISVGIR